MRARLPVAAVCQTPRDIVQDEHAGQKQQTHRQIHGLGARVPRRTRRPVCMKMNGLPTDVQQHKSHTCHQGTYMKFHTFDETYVFLSKG